MDRFSSIVLEHTLALTSEAIPTDSDPRVMECIAIIRRYLNCIADDDSTQYYRGLQEALCELSGLALQHREVRHCCCLQDIVRQLSHTAQEYPHDRSQVKSWKTAIVRLLLG